VQLRNRSGSAERRSMCAQSWRKHTTIRVIVENELSGGLSAQAGL
jgi:hypothetical protein